MANYFIDIIDTENDNLVLQLEYAQRNSLKLSWEGGDRKDELSIVPSTLEFSMEVSVFENTDAKFIDLFTSNEQRYLVELKTEVGKGRVWAGYLLPDSYSEPYTSGTFYISFFAVCGLSTLKNKYLPNTYYQSENSVLDIYKEILKLTQIKNFGQSVELLFKPAIVNVAQPDYSKIYINGNNFVKDKQRQSAYDILNDLLTSMLCVCYQADNKWYVEGLNYRSERLVAFERQFPRPDPRVAKSYKELEAINKPLVTIVPAVGRLTSQYEPAPFALPEGLVKAQLPWENTGPIESNLYPINWEVSYADDSVGSKSFLYHNAENGNLELSRLDRDVSLLAGHFLKKPIYIPGGYLYTFEMAIKFKRVLVSDSQLQDLGGALRFEVTVGNSIFVANGLSGRASAGRDNFNVKQDYTATLSKSFYLPFSGNFNIKLGSKDVTGLLGVNALIEITSIKLSSNFNSDEKAIEEIQVSESTLNKDLTIAYSENPNAVGRCFQLEKVVPTRENDSFKSNQIFELTVLEVYEDSDNYYYVLNNESAWLAYHYLNNLYADVEVRQLLDNVTSVLFNYKNTEQHVLVANKSVRHASLYVFVPSAPPDYFNTRQSWLSWRDARFENENTPYLQAINTVYGRLLSTSYVNLAATLLGAVQFNDLVNFNYVSAQNYLLTNVTWNIDDGTSDVVMESATYGQSNALFSSSLKPIVNVGGDKYFRVPYNNAPQINVSAFSLGARLSAFAWEVLEGDITLSSLFSQNVTVNFNTTNVNKLRFTATDSLGNSTSEEVYVYFVGPVQLKMVRDDLSSNFTPTNASFGSYFAFGLANSEISGVGFNQDAKIYGNTLLMLNFNYGLAVERLAYGENEVTSQEFEVLNNHFLRILVQKNNKLVASSIITGRDDLKSTSEFKEGKQGSIAVSYRAGDKIKISIYSNSSAYLIKAAAYIALSSVNVLEGDSFLNSQSFNRTGLMFTLKNPVLSFNEANFNGDFADYFNGISDKKI